VGMHGEIPACFGNLPLEILKVVDVGLVGQVPSRLCGARPMNGLNPNLYGCRAIACPAGEFEPIHGREDGNQTECQQCPVASNVIGSTTCKVVDGTTVETVAPTATLTTAPAASIMPTLAPLETPNTLPSSAPSHVPPTVDVKPFPEPSQEPSSMPSSLSTVERVTNAPTSAAQSGAVTPAPTPPPPSRLVNWKLLGSAVGLSMLAVGTVFMVRRHRMEHDKFMDNTRYQPETRVTIPVCFFLLFNSDLCCHMSDLFFIFWLL
jgi:hypothetical protein